MAMDDPEGKQKLVPLLAHLVEAGELSTSQTTKAGRGGAGRGGRGLEELWDQSRPGGELQEWSSWAGWPGGREAGRREEAGPTDPGRAESCKRLARPGWGRQCPAAV